MNDVDPLSFAPGWSYDHHQEISAETARLMRAVGFVFQDRHA
jgi:hypothetical protein